MQVTLISTVLNEGENIRGLLDSIVRQTRQPDEVIFVDGGSSDQTVAVLESYRGRLPLRVMVAAGCNISEGRNIAIKAARGEIIAATDAGVILADNWLEAIIAPFDADPTVDMVGGFFEADARTTFELAMGATVLPLANEIDGVDFLPSSRSVAFRRALAEQVGGYPEWLDYCEDLIFDLRMKDSAQRFVFAPDAIAHFRPRGSLRSFWKQYRLYARGDGKADLWRKRHAIRYATYLVGVPLIWLLGTQVHKFLWGLALVGGAVYTRRPYQRLRALWRHTPDPSLAALAQAVALVPVIRVVGDVAKMVGYPLGWVWRLKNQPPDWKSTPQSPS